MKKITALFLSLLLLLSLFPGIALADPGDNEYEEYESNNDHLTADRVYSDYTVYGALSPFYDLDYFEFFLPNASIVQIISSGQSPHFIAIENASEEILVSKEATDPSCSTVIERVLPAGTYYLCIGNSRDLPSYNIYALYFYWLPISGHTHSYSSSIIAATCTEQGYTLHTCTCGDSYKDNYTNPFGHSWGSGVIVQSADCTNTGIIKYSCGFCFATRTETIPTNNNHNFYNGFCTRCGAKEGTISGGSCGDGVYWRFDTNGVLTIYGNGALKDYRGSVPPWRNLDVKSVVIQDGVTRIGDSAFEFCKNMTSVTISDSVTVIGDHAFGSCAGLTSVTIPDSVTSISSGAFNGCTSLKSVTIGNGATGTGYSAFAGCTSLESVTIGTGMLYISDESFKGCSKLSSINLPGKVQSIGGSAFSGCSSLSSIDIPASVTKIGYSAFSDCTKLSTVNYSGTKDQWSKINIMSSNNSLLSANIICEPFSDVPKGSVYYDAIMWAYYHKPQQITGGFTASEFRPGNPCTRGQVVTFLWRAAGCPEPTTTKNPFSDVSAKQSNGKDNPYYKAILWAAEKGITTGYDGGLFKPNDTVTRGQFVTFLWRAEGKPATVGSINGFADAAKISAPFQQAVAWAVEKGITTGYNDNTFRPNDACTRWAVVLFMYRDMK